MGINFQKFKQGQNFDTTTEVNLSKNAKMGKQLWMGQFWPKILFFSWVPSFGSYIDDQNLNGPLGLKRAYSGYPWLYGPQQPELAWITNELLFATNELLFMKFINDIC